MSETWPPSTGPEDADDPGAAATGDPQATGGSPIPLGPVMPDYRRPADARINWEQRGPRPPAPGNVPPG